MRTWMALLPLMTTAAHAAGPICQVRSGPTSPLVVELYTSEGCSSCPPADAWLSSLKARQDVLPLAFHVNYWDRLGWADRFATSEGTARQWEQARAAGRLQVYTPQVLAGGRDWRDWPRLPGGAVPSSLEITLTRDGDEVRAEVATARQAPARLAGYWAVVEDGHSSRVRGGENAGRALQHDHVVRQFRPVPPWVAAQGSTARLNVGPADPTHPRRVVLVVTDASTSRPLQALALPC